MASFSVCKLTCLVLAISLVLAPSAEAQMTCGIVVRSLKPCVRYLRGKGGLVPPACCSGIKSLNATANTKANRQIACGCMKAASRGISDLNFGLVGSLPSKCGVRIPCRFSPNTDCTKVK